MQQSLEETWKSAVPHLMICTRNTFCLSVQFDDPKQLWGLHQQGKALLEFCLPSCLLYEVSLKREHRGHFLKGLHYTAQSRWLSGLAVFAAFLTTTLAADRPQNPNQNATALPVAQRSDPSHENEAFDWIPCRYYYEDLSQYAQHALCFCACRDRWYLGYFACFLEKDTQGEEILGLD